MSFIKREVEELPMEQIPVSEMVAYCQKYIDGLKREIANGDGEPWMHESIRIEEAIIKRLTAN